MFNNDLWQEIFSTIRNNKLRTFLTGFSVAWGIFMLVILLGAGNGVINGSMNFFNSSLTNSLWIWGFRTSMEHDGFQEGRRIILTNEDYDIIGESIEGLDLVSSRYQLPTDGTISYNGNYGAFQVRTVYPDYKTIENIKVIEGRFVNITDINKMRKVVIISTSVRDFFFNDKEAIGKYIRVDGIPLLVVGVFEDIDTWDNNRCVYFPVTTAQKVFGVNEISTLAVTVRPGYDVEQTVVVEQKIREKLAKIHRFNPKDERAVHIYNSFENLQRTMDGMRAIKIAIWIIGIGTILAGIVGISNIMLIVIKERTKEIGIRKALGAKPASIVSMIIQESVLITSVSGFLGLFFGVLLLEVLSGKIDVRGFSHPEADIGIAISATVLLVVAGALAGLVPARRAANIKPIIALRDE